MTGSSNTAIPRPEHPRPDFMRETFENLNGTWQFAFDDEDEGIEARWYLPGVKLEREITVPFCYQSRASGIGPTDEIHPVLWYRRAFTVPESMRGRRVLLRFGAVDYACRVYVNGQMAGEHTGGYVPFTLDITPLLTDAENDLCVRVRDDPDCTQPRGKQYWKTGLMGCWYTPVSGIWQTVYLEAVGTCAIRTVHVTPDIDRCSICAQIELERCPQSAYELELAVSFEGEARRTVRVSAQERVVNVPVDMDVEGGIDRVRWWSPKDPALYDLRVRVLIGGEVVDTVQTYFGMRKIEVRDGEVYLNNSPIYQRLVLDQGYWPDSLITPPSDEAIRSDLRYTLDFGYNGARKHQKMEDPRYYYWADKMGVLVWGELPSPYRFADRTVANLADTLLGFIERDFNHPCIICWVPLNESWGVRSIYADAREQATARMLCQLTRAADGTRLCSSNDGWEQVEADICALHDYADDKDEFAKHFESRERVEKHACDVRPCYVRGETPTGREAFMVTEYGGIAFERIGRQGEMGGVRTWGYHEKVTDTEAFFARFTDVTDAIREIPYCRGYCYTQLTDVMQEINGLLTPERKPKVDPARFRLLNGNPLGRRTYPF